MNKEFTFTCPNDLSVYSAVLVDELSDKWYVSWTNKDGKFTDLYYDDLEFYLKNWKAEYKSGWDGFFDKEKKEEKEVKALDKQVSGDHYKSFKIQPAEYNHANNIGFLEGNVIKYVSRYKNKNGKKDLEKAIHCLEILIQLEYPDE